MFRSSTIITEPALNLAKVMFMLKHSVKLRRYLLCGSRKHPINDMRSVCYYVAFFRSLQSVYNDMHLHCSPLLAMPVHSGF